MEPIVFNSINPGWVLTGVMSIMVFLLWRMLVTMQEEIKHTATRVNDHDVVLGEHHLKHEAHTKEIDQHSEELRILTNERSKLADDIIAKLRAAGRV